MVTLLRLHPETQKLEPPCTAEENSTTGKYCSVAFMNGHILGFHPQTQKLEPPFTT